MNLSPLPIQKFFGNNGRPLNGGKLFTYVAGTTTKIATYIDSTGVTPNTNPIILNFRGECRLWLDPTLTYKFVLSPANDTDPPTAPIWTVDNITVSPQPFDNTATDTGTANNIQLAIPRISSPTLFTRIIFKVLNSNTGATTISINNGTAHPVAWQSDFPMTGGEIIAGGIYEAIYDGASWQIQGPALQPGDIRLYGAVLDGVTDDTAAITRWAALGGNLTWPVPRTGRITSAIALQSFSTITFVSGAAITTSTPDISMLSATSKSNIVINGGKLIQTVAGNAANVAALFLDSCALCTVQGMEIQGAQWAGIVLNSCSNCIVDSNYLHDFLASSAGDKCDIIVYRNSVYNTISNNRCYGGVNSFYGIMVQDPLGLGNFLPARNKVIGNFVTDHAGYGILFYIGGASQRGDNLCLGNTIENIRGTVLAGASGSGIYCVGNGLGSMVVDSNIVRNCCISTTSTSNGPAGISVNDTVADGPKVMVVNNTVDEMSQGHGILVSTDRGGAVDGNNTVRMPSSNNGTGAGGASLLGDAYRIAESSYITVTGNAGRNAGTGECFFSFAVAASVIGLSVTGNTFYAASANALRVDRNAAFTHTDVTITGNHLRSDGAVAGNLIQIVAIDRCTINGNTGGSNAGPALNVTGCTFVLASGNSFNSNATNGITTAGTCTGSKYDISNRTSGNISNGATGFRFEFLGGIPGAGLFVAGDTVWFTAPAAGAAPGAICTTGGTGGGTAVFKNMAALAP